MTAILTIVEKLLSLALSSEAKVLTDPSKAEFQDTLARWTDVDKKQPHAVVMPATEDDVVKIVKWATLASVPFVPKAGGHSAWSTIGSEGFILDFSLMRSVEVDTEKQTATASAGTLIGDIIKAVSAKDFCVVTGTVNTVGFIPSTIGGGLSMLSPVLGYGSDNIISARLLTASGEVVNVSAGSHPDLLYAIKGAGQFFGIVLSLTVKIHPLSVLGSPTGTIWTATYIFPTSRAADVATAALEIRRTSKKSYLLAGVMGAPPTLDPVILVIAAYLGTKAEGADYFKGLLDLGPVATASDTEVTFGELNNTFAAFESKGGFKKWYAPGLTAVEQFKPEEMEYFVETQAKVAGEFPSAKPTGFVIEFVSDGPFDKVSAEKETAFSHRDVKLFVHLLCWAFDEDGVKGAEKAAEAAMAHVRRNQPKEEYSFYQNFSRAVPVEERYRGQERLQKLRELKKQWDPKGYFTTQLL